MHIGTIDDGAKAVQEVYSNRTSFLFTSSHCYWINKKDSRLGIDCNAEIR
jgi:hypothetical protein